MRKLRLVCFLALLNGVFSFAQNTAGDHSFWSKPRNPWNWSGLRKKHDRKNNLRGRFQALPFNLEDFTSLTLNGKPTIIDANVKIHNISILADWYPFQNSSFKLIGGVSYFFK